MQRKIVTYETAVCECGKDKLEINADYSLSFEEDYKVREMIINKIRWEMNKK